MLTFAETAQADAATHAYDDLQLLLLTFAETTQADKGYVGY